MKHYLERKTQATRNQEEARKAFTHSCEEQTFIDEVYAELFDDPSSIAV